MKTQKTIVAFLISALGLFLSCIDSHNSRCDKYNGLHKEELKYAQEHIPTIGQVNIYVENSGSMDGYVSENTEFKTDLFNIIKLLGSESKTPTKKYFINDSIISVNLSDNQYTNGMSQKSFAQLGGNRTTSNIAELIEKLVISHKKGNVDVFVSDCVFDPENALDIQKRLGQQKTTVQTAIKKQLLNNPEFGVLVYKLTSTFNGTYYNKVKPHTTLKDHLRPYYVWIFTETVNLIKVRELLLKDIENKKGTETMVAINGVEHIPYTSPAAKCNNNRGKHIDDPQLKNNKFSFLIRTDLSTMPLDKSYLSNIDNYTILNKDYYLESVKKYNSGKSSSSIKYTHEIKVGKVKGNVKDNTEIVVTLKRPNFPKWVTLCNDPNGSDYLNGKISTKCRTFGIESYLKGVHQAYSGDLASFKILIK